MSVTTQAIRVGAENIGSDVRSSDCFLRLEYVYVTIFVLFRSPFLFVDSLTAFVYDFTSSKKNSDRRRCAVRKKRERCMSRQHMWFLISPAR